MKKYLLKNRVLFVLVGSRIYYRLSLILLNITLFYMWDKEVYGNYATRIGIWSILRPIVGIGIGKCALKLLPIYKRLKVLIIRNLIYISSAVSFLMLLIVVGVNIIFVVFFESTLDVLDIIIGLYSILGGFTVALQFIGRGLNRNNYDYVLSIVFGSFTILLCLYCLYMTTTPIQLMVYQVIVYGTLNLVVMYRLFKTHPVRRKKSNKSHRIIVRRILKESTIMGGNSLIGNAGFSVISSTFRFYKLFEAAGYFNLVLSIGTFILAFFEYLLNLVFPKITYMAYNNKKYTSIDYIKKFIRPSLILIGLLMLIAITISLVTPEEIIYLFIIWVFLIPVFMVNEIILVWFEAVLRKGLSKTIRGCFLGLITCSVLSFIILPYGQASSALIILAIAEITTSIYILYLFFKGH